MTTYEIKTNTQYNSNEVYFEGKPSAEVIANLKTLKMRWNPKKICWYGFAGQNDIIKAITGATQEAQPKEYETGTVYSEGYFGATRTDGVNSHKYLYGSKLSKAIREHINHAGIKGVTVSVETYAGGQSITAKIKCTPADLIPFDEYVKTFEINPGWNWYTDENGNTIDVHSDTYFNLPTLEAQNELKNKIALFEYNRALNGQEVNQYHISKYTEYTTEFANKLKAVNEIIKSYNYDDSNSMVDYFDTNFYYTLKTVA